MDGVTNALIHVFTGFATVLMPKCCQSCNHMHLCSPAITSTQPQKLCIRWMLFLQNTNLNSSFFQRLLCPQCLCGIWFRCLQQFKLCVATIQLFKAGMSQTYTKAELLCSLQEWFHPYICVLSLFSLDTIHLPLDQGDNCILKVLWMFKPIFKPINHHVNKASLGKKKQCFNRGHQQRAVTDCGCKELCEQIRYKTRA